MVTCVKVYLVSLLIYSFDVDNGPKAAEFIKVLLHYLSISRLTILKNQVLVTRLESEAPFWAPSLNDIVSSLSLNTI